MTEPNLTLSKTDLEGEIGLYLGYGRGLDNGDTDWTAEQEAVIHSIRASGERQFYFNPAVVEQGVPASHDWSFLRPYKTMTLPNGAATVLLPDDFGGIEGEVILSVSGSSGYWPVPICGDVRHLHALSPDTTGRPREAAIEVLKGTSGEASSRFQFRFWPSADQAYTLQFRYYVLADALSGTRPYAYGGMAHAETIKASCLAAAEWILDNKRDVNWANFLDRLVASVNHDRRTKAQALGYNGDRSDVRHVRWFQQRFEEDNRVTFNGVAYD